MFRLVRSHGKLLGNNLAFPFSLDVVYSIKECLSPHAEELHAHTQPKSFKFVRDEEGHCIMYYRNYSHMKWKGPQ